MFALTVITSDAIAQASAPAADPAIARLVSDGWKTFDAGRPDQALKLFRDATKASRDTCVDCRVGEATALIEMGNPGGALKTARKALAIAADDAARASAHAAIGDSLLASEGGAKKIEEARTEYERATALAPAHAGHHLKLAIALFKLRQDEAGKAETERYLDLAPTGRYAEYARALMADPRRARESFAPDFTVRTLSGDTLTLADLKGKFVVLDFWATWCPPCVASVGELKDLTKKYSRDRLVLVSISADEDEAKWRTFVASKGMNWEHFWDRDRQLQKGYGVRGFPTYILIDPEGIIRERIVGLDPRASVVARLKKALAAINLEKS